MVCARSHMRLLLLTLSVILCLPSISGAGVSVRPKYIFLDGSRRSVPIYVNNPGPEANEVWVEVKYGYVSTDDTGRAQILFDTTDVETPSAAAWVKAFPQRFVLDGGETQTVRLVALPPPGLKDGEYWARIVVTGKPRKGTQSAKPNAQNLKSGVIFMTGVGLAFHYRHGKLSTGVRVSDLRAVARDQGIDITMNLAREGNASFWGTCRFQVVDDGGRTVFSTIRNAVVYKTLLFREVIDRKSIPAGHYSISLEFVTGKRNDIENVSLVQAQPVRTSTTVDLP
jgi:hypothetical protein